MDVNIEYFEWKFVKNPAGFVEGYIAVSDEGEIAAYYGVIPEIYIINGKPTTIYQSCDTMTHSKHRRKGLFQKLALHCYECLKNENKLFVIGFGGGQSTPGFLKFGWIHVFNMKYYFFPKVFSFLKKPLNEKIKTLEDFSSIEDIILKSNSFTPIHSYKTLEIFKWRLSNPIYKYKVLAYQTENFVYSSYLCYYINNDKIILFDFSFANIKEGKAMIGQLKNEFLKTKCKAILTFLQENSVYSKTLKKMGFISNPFSKGPLSIKVPFIFYSDNEHLLEFNDKNKWLINSFDHDAM